MDQEACRRCKGGYLIAALLVALSSGISAAWGAAEEIVGVWDLTTNGTGWQALGTLSIAKNADGTLTGKWGSVDLSNVKFEDHQKLTFVRLVRAGDVAFSGTLTDGTLTLSDTRGGKVTGVPRKPKTPVLGQWDLKCDVEGLVVPVRLVVSQRPGAAPEAKWITNFAQTVIWNVKIEGDKLTLSQETTFENATFESSLEGTVRGHALTGTVRSPLGNLPITGQRIGVALIGKWELKLATPQGQRTHVLTIDTDLTGRYERPETFGGEVPIKDLKLDGDRASFKTEVNLGDRTDVTECKFTLDGKTLKGQSASERGIVELTGRKVESMPSPTRPGSPSQAGAG